MCDLFQKQFYTLGFCQIYMLTKFGYLNIFIPEVINKKALPLIIFEMVFMSLFFEMRNLYFLFKLFIIHDPIEDKE